MDTDNNVLPTELIHRIHVLACMILGLDSEDHEDDEEAAPLEKLLTTLVVSVRIRSALEAIDLLHWKYKELNDQSVDMKFAEAYGIIRDEYRAQGNQENLNV